MTRRECSPVLLTFLSDEPFDGFPRASALVAVAQMGPLMVVVVQPSVEVGLQRRDAVEQLLVHGRAEELFQHRAVEALDEAVRARRADPGFSVLDVAEGQVELVGVSPVGFADVPPGDRPLADGAAELPAPSRPAGRTCFADRIDGLLTIDCR